MKQRLHAAGNRAHLATVLRAQRRGPGNEAERIVDRYRDESVRARRERGGEVAAQVVSHRQAMQRRTDGVARAGRPDDAARARLERTDAHFITHVPRFRGVRRRRIVRDADVARGRHPDARVGHPLDEPAHRRRMQANGGVGVDDDLTAKERARCVLGCGLATSHRHAQQLHALAGIFSHDLVGAVRRRVRQDENLAPLRRIVLRDKSVDCAADLHFLVVGRNHDAHERPFAGRRHVRCARRGEQPEQRGIYRIRVDEQHRGEREQNPPDHEHLATVTMKCRGETVGNRDSR